MAIGFICLNKQLKGDTERVVYVGHKKYDNIDVIKLMDNIYPLNGGGKRVPGTALSELIDQIADYKISNSAFDSLKSRALVFINILS